MKTILFTLLAFEGSLTSQARSLDDNGEEHESYGSTRRWIDGNRYQLQDDLETFRDNADNISTLDAWVKKIRSDEKDLDEALNWLKKHYPTNNEPFHP